eukprot:PITA_20282
MAQMDSIMGYMTNLLERYNLIDVPMNNPLPTWRNRRVGEGALVRRLDRFIMKRALIQQLHNYKQWVGVGGISDHSPVYLEILGPHHKPKSPFKFNHHKHLSIKWAREKHQRENLALLHIESELCSLLDECGLGVITAEDKSHLVELEKQKLQILKDREKFIRLQIWLKYGYDNTQFFHNYAKGRKVTNTIWNILSPEGGVENTFNKLSHLGSTHFRNLYKHPPGSTITDIINVAGHFPRFLNEDEAMSLFDLVTPGQLEGTLKWFKKDKILGLDGWTIKFYLAFYELLSHDLLRVVEECRESGSLYNATNTTFITLIPKSDSPSSFKYYRPIFLCNCLYKIISKIIANRLRPILSCHIAPQQFSFLEHRQIHEAIGSTQEALHTIWTKHLKSITLKINLAKAFDCVSWLYIKMLLIHLGFPLSFITSIMACITTPTFSVLINGSASHFFHSKRGLRQGCPLSPLLFLIVMDGLNRLIASAKRDGDLCGLKISDDCFLTHLLFVDDVIIFLDGSIRDSHSF